MSRRQFTYRISNKSLIQNNLQRSNNIFLQPVSTSWRAKEDHAGETFYVTAYMSRGRYGISNLNLAPDNTLNIRSCSEQLPPRPLTLGGGPPTSGGPPTGATTSTTSPTTGAGVGEVDAGATTTSALLLPTAQQHQHRESCAVVSSNFMCKPENFGVTLNPAPTGSLNRQLLVSEGSGGPITTEWNMCIFPELYTKETKQPQTFPNSGHQGGTQPARERNIPITSNYPQK